MTAPYAYLVGYFDGEWTTREVSDLAQYSPNAILPGDWS